MTFRQPPQSISPPARAALEKRTEAMKRLLAKGDAFEAQYTRLVENLSETAFRSLVNVVTRELVHRDGFAGYEEFAAATHEELEAIRKVWTEKMIQENMKP